jgi:hypothetical protein
VGGGTAGGGTAGGGTAGGGTAGGGTAGGGTAGGGTAGGGTAGGAAGGQGRDWVHYPAIFQRATANTLYAVSDIHGGYDRFVALLAHYGIISAVPTTASQANWAAGNAVLVVAGDMIDKGPKGVEVIDALRALQVGATAAGGDVIVVLGNHEAEFMVDPLNSKANGTDGIDVELQALNITPSSVASGMEQHGAWLRQRPFGARVGRWFFSHAGDTHGRTVQQLETLLEAAVDAHNYNSADLIGVDSLLESRSWYAADATIAARYAQSVGASHIVFGHDPNALGPTGAIAIAQGGALMRIDCGMSPDVNYSQGALLRVRFDGVNDIAEQLAANGTVSLLWMGVAN